MHGWEPAETTVFEYDGDQLIRTVTTLEPEFDADGVAYLLASREMQDEPRNELGILQSVAMDTQNQFRFKPPEMPSIDWSAKSLGDARDKYYKANPDASRNGHVWRNPTLVPLPKEVDDGTNEAN